MNITLTILKLRRKVRTMSTPSNDEALENISFLCSGILSDIRKLKQYEEHFELLDFDEETIANTLVSCGEALADVKSKFWDEIEEREEE